MTGTTASPRGDLLDPTCPTRGLLDRVGSKWVVMVLLVLGERELRYADLKRAVPGVSAKMLTQTLRGLDRDGLVARRVEPTTPPSVFYRVTPLGRTLQPVLADLREWAEAHMAEVDGLAPPS